MSPPRQAYLDDFRNPELRELDLDVLTDAERDIYVAVEIADEGVREYQRGHDWSSPGTASNLLRRARDKLEGSA